MRGTEATLVCVLCASFTLSCDGEERTGAFAEMALAAPACPPPTVQQAQGGGCEIPAEATCLVQTLRIDTAGVRLNGKGRVLTNCFPTTSAAPAILVTAPDVLINNLGIDGFLRGVVVYGVKPSSRGPSVRLSDLEVNGAPPFGTALASGVSIIDSDRVVLADSSFSVGGLSIGILGVSRDTTIVGNTTTQGAGVTVCSPPTELNATGVPVVVPVTYIPVMGEGGAIELLPYAYQTNRGNTSGVHLGPERTTIDSNVITSTLPYSAIAVLDEARDTVVTNNQIAPLPGLTVSGASGLFMVTFTGIRTAPGRCGGGGAWCTTDTQCATGVTCQGAQTFNVPVDYDASSSDTTIDGNTVVAPANNGLLVNFARGLTVTNNELHGGNGAGIALAQHGIDDATSLISGNVVAKRPEAEANAPNFSAAIILNGSTVAGRVPGGYAVQLSGNQVTGRVTLINFGFQAELSAGGVGNLWTLVGCSPMTSLLTRFTAPPPTVICGPPTSATCSPPPPGIQDSHQLSAIPPMLCP